MTPEQIVTACRDADVRLVRFLYCDNGAIVRGKVVHVDRLAERLHSGIGLTVAMQAMNSLDQLQPVEGMGPVGEMRLVPDLDTFALAPYAPGAAVLLVDMMDLDRRPHPACPRGFLRRMAGRLDQRGWELRAAVESEFSLARPGDDGPVPIDRSLCFSTAGMTAAQQVADAIASALGTQGIQIEQYYPELGHGQQELSVAPRPVLAAADTQVLVRETIRAVAAGFGLTASLAPKPWPDVAGNGAHIHFSLWEGDRNVFYDPAARFGLSELAVRFTAGILAHVPGLLGLTAPSVNSYQRLLPQHWSSAFTCWGPDNREATVRVPSTFWDAEQASTNLEFKPTDASSNPYLAFGALIAAGLDGVDRGLVPPDPLLVDPVTLSDQERAGAGVERYPQAALEALDLLAKDDVLQEALGEQLARSYLAVRRSEAEAYAALGPSAQYAGHFDKY